MNDVGHEAMRLEKVVRSYKQGEGSLDILRGADFSLHRGEAVALVAPSGAGKSTLLHVAGLLERPDGGDVIMAGESAGRMDDDQRTRLRRTSIGFVYQFHHLLPEFTARENIMIPQMIAGLERAEAGRRAEALLKFLGLSGREKHRPAQLSGGEQQRVAIARAVANAPHILLCDEPTGNLDPGTAEHVFDTMMNLVRASGLALLIATHNLEIADRMDRRITLHEGLIVNADDYL